MTARMQGKSLKAWVAEVIAKGVAGT